MTKEELLALNQGQLLALAVMAKPNVDCTNCTGCDGCEVCDNCTDCTACISCVNCQNCESSNDCVACANCTSCRDCLGILHGKGLRYVAFGIQLSHTEYNTVLATYNGE